MQKHLLQSVTSCKQNIKCLMKIYISLMSSKYGHNKNIGDLNNF